MQQLLSHLTGIAEDWTTGRFDGYASAAWTDEQVARHAGRPWDELRAAWLAALGSLPSVDPHPQLGAPWRWLFGDALCHEADLREAADDVTRPPDEVVLVGLRQMAARWRQTLAQRDDRLVLDAIGVRTWDLGRDGGPAARVAADPYELWRAVSGRRSIDEIDRYDWSGGRAADWFAVLPYPFEVPAPRDAP